MAEIFLSLLTMGLGVGRRFVKNPNGEPLNHPIAEKSTDIQDEKKKKESHFPSTNELGICIDENKSIDEASSKTIYPTNNQNESNSFGTEEDQMGISICVQPNNKSMSCNMTETVDYVNKDNPEQIGGIMIAVSIENSSQQLQSNHLLCNLNAGATNSTEPNELGPTECYSSDKSAIDPRADNIETFNDVFNHTESPPLVLEDDGLNECEECLEDVTVCNEQGENSTCECRSQVELNQCRSSGEDEGLNCQGCSNDSPILLETCPQQVIVHVLGCTDDHFKAPQCDGFESPCHEFECSSKERELLGQGSSNGSEQALECPIPCTLIRETLTGHTFGAQKGNMDSYIQDDQPTVMYSKQILYPFQNMGQATILGDGAGSDHGSHGGSHASLRSHGLTHGSHGGSHTGSHASHGLHGSRGIVQNHDLEAHAHDHEERHTHVPHHEAEILVKSTTSQGVSTDDLIETQTRKRRRAPLRKQGRKVQVRGKRTFSGRRNVKRKVMRYKRKQRKRRRNLPKPKSRKRKTSSSRTSSIYRKRIKNEESKQRFKGGLIQLGELSASEFALSEEASSAKSLKA